MNAATSLYRNSESTRYFVNAEVTDRQTELINTFRVCWNVFKIIMYLKNEN